METAVHGLPHGDVAVGVAVDLLEAEGAVVFEALEADCGAGESDAAEAFDGVVPELEDVLAIPVGTGLL
jgi:hypothetical protein